MKILALDSSGLVASAAIVEDDVLIAEYTTDYKKTHSQTLLPMLDEIRQMIDLDLHTIDAIAISAGPGSFTGLRIGAATAKGLGLALNLPLVEVPTLEGLAFNLWGTDKLVCPIMDARRNQTYTGIYSFDNGELQVIREQCAVGISDIIGQISEIGQPVVFLGDGVPVFSSYIEENCKAPYLFAPAHMNKQRAGSVAWLGMQYAKAGKLETAAEHRPDYLRMSQAERERKERLKAEKAAGAGEE